MLSSRRQLAVLVLVQPDFELASSRRTCAGVRENRTIEYYHSYPAINSARLNLMRSVTLLQFSLFNRFGATERSSEVCESVCVWSETAFELKSEIALTLRLPAEQQVFVSRSRFGQRFVVIKTPVALRQYGRWFPVRKYAFHRNRLKTFLVLDLILMISFRFLLGSSL